MKVTVDSKKGFSKKLDFPKSIKSGAIGRICISDTTSKNYDKPGKKNDKFSYENIIFR